MEGDDMFQQGCNGTNYSRYVEKTRSISSLITAKIDTFPKTNFYDMRSLSLLKYPRKGFNLL